MTEGEAARNDAPQSPPPRRPSFLRRHWGKLAVLSIVLIPLLVLMAWSWITLSYTYSSGERVGYVQKLSKKGWLCKTWEGELAMANLPGTMPQLFNFSVRDDDVAKQIESYGGQPVAIAYRQHRGVPFSCFGETEYFVNAVRPVSAPSLRGTLPAPPAPAPPSVRQPPPSGP